MPESSGQFSKKDLAWLLARSKFEEKIIKDAISEIAPRLQDLQEGEFEKAIKEIRDGYFERRLECEFINTSPSTKTDLEKLSKNAKALAKTMEKMKVGVNELLNMRVGGGYLSDPPEGVRFNEFGTWEGWEEGFDLERWVSKLRALAKRSDEWFAWITKSSGKGGRVPLSNRIFGSPDLWLAGACKHFVEKHGCRSQTVVARLVLAIKEVSEGKKLGKGAGKKAVRNLA